MLLTAPQVRAQLAADMLSLCDSLPTDRTLDATEVEALRTWLRDSAGHDLPQHLRNVVSRAIVTGRLTHDERHEVYRAVEPIRPPATGRHALSGAPARAAWATAAVFTGLIGLAALVAVLSTH